MLLECFFVQGEHRLWQPGRSHKAHNMSKNRRNPTFAKNTIPVTGLLDLARAIPIRPAKDLISANIAITGSSLYQIPSPPLPCLDSMITDRSMYLYTYV